MSTCSASCAPRFGRNPNEHGNMSASNIGSSTIFTAACTIRSRTEGIDNGRMLRRVTRLGDKHPPRRQRPIRSVPQLVGQLIQQPGHPVLLDLGQGGLVDARCARRCGAPRPTPRHRTSLRIDLVPQRMKPSPGIGLGRPVQRMLQGTNRIRRNRPHSGGTSHNGTHRAPPSQQYASTKQRPFPHRRLCCPLGSSSTTAASDAHPARHPLPGIPVIGRVAPMTPSAGHRAGEGLSSSRRHPLIRSAAPYAGESFTAASPGSSPLPWPSP